MRSAPQFGTIPQVEIPGWRYPGANTWGKIPRDPSRTVRTENLIDRDERTKRGEAIDGRGGFPVAASRRGRPPLCRGLRAARLDQPDRALCAVRHLAVESGNRAELRPGASARAADDSVPVRRRAAVRSRAPAAAAAVAGRAVRRAADRRRLCDRAAGADASAPALRSRAVVDARSRPADGRRGGERSGRRMRLCRPRHCGRSAAAGGLRLGGDALLGRRRDRHHRGHAVHAARADAPAHAADVARERAAVRRHLRRAGARARLLRRAPVPAVLRAVPADRLDGGALRVGGRHGRHPGHPARPDRRVHPVSRGGERRHRVPGADAGARRDRPRRRRAGHRAPPHRDAAAAAAGTRCRAWRGSAAWASSRPRSPTS